MTKRILTVFAPGLEEVEAVTAVDLLRRAGVAVTIAGLDTREIEGSHGIALTADVLLGEERGDFDGIVLPGGMPGTVNLMESDRVLGRVRACHESGKLCAAICAAPRVLDAAGVLEGRRFTCYPAVSEKIVNGRFVEEPVVRDGHIVTGTGVGTAIPFALELVDYLTGADNARSLAGAIVYNRQTE
jgi:4-methyl-5(b-hydroxyethyl)-thiazole monophosphate biosynthesis